MHPMSRLPAKPVRFFRAKFQPPKPAGKGKVKSAKLSKAEKEKLKKEEAERKAREEGVPIWQQWTSETEGSDFN